MKDSDIIKKFREKCGHLVVYDSSCGDMAFKEFSIYPDVELFFLSTLHQYRQEVLKGIREISKQDFGYGTEPVTRIVFLSDIEALLKVKE